MGNDGRSALLVVRIPVEGGATCEGRVEDVLVGAGPCRLVVAFAQVPPRLAVGGQVALELDGAALSSPLSARGQVVARLQEERAEIYQIELAHGSADGHPGGSPAPGGPRPGSRTSLRVRPEGEIPVELRLPGQVLAGQLADLSGSGAAVLVPPECERQIPPAARVGLEFSLPGEERAFDPLGEVSSRRFQEGRVRLGIEFLPPAGERQAALQQRLVDWILARQVESLRRLLGDSQEP